MRFQLFTTADGQQALIEDRTRPPDKTDLTYITIASYISQHGYPPSITELAERLGIARSTAAARVDALVEAGRISKAPGVTRGIVIEKPLTKADLDAARERGRRILELFEDEE